VAHTTPIIAFSLCDLDAREEHMVRESPCGSVRPFIHTVRVSQKRQLRVQSRPVRSIVVADLANVLAENGKSIFKLVLLASKNIYGDCAFKMGAEQTILLVFESTLFRQHALKVLVSSRHHRIELVVDHLPDGRPI
jgi:hypothetical protein